MRGRAYDEEHILPEVVRRLAAIPAYVAQFERAYGSPGVTTDRLGGAIAAFERSLVTTDSSFDRYMRGDATAMTALQVRGMDVFQESGCGGCHSGPMFSDFELHALGVPDLPGAAHDAGDGRNRFRTASLRFVTRTAPYMHNGVFNSLNDVYGFYRRAAGRAADPALRGVRAPQGDEAAAVTAFLEALSNGTLDTTVPASVPSGLAVGGAIR
jgi:cytochrome c peroxidase